MHVLQDVIVSHGSYLRDCTVEHAIIGVRSRIESGVQIKARPLRCAALRCAGPGLLCYCLCMCMHMQRAVCQGFKGAVGWWSGRRGAGQEEGQHGCLRGLPAPAEPSFIRARAGESDPGNLIQGI